MPADVCMMAVSGEGEFKFKFKKIDIDIYSFVIFFAVFLLRVSRMDEVCMESMQIDRYLHTEPINQLLCRAKFLFRFVVDWLIELAVDWNSPFKFPTGRAVVPCSIKLSVLFCRKKKDNIYINK